VHWTADVNVSGQCEPHPAYGPVLKKQPASFDEVKKPLKKRKQTPHEIRPALSDAKGKILGHNIADANGRRLLRKGKPLTDNDLEHLRELGRKSVYVARMEAEDVDENTAARRIAEAVCGPGLSLSSGSVGRVNLLSSEMGLLRVDVDRLTRINECDGITLATLLTHSPVHERQIVATVKIIPYAVPESVLSAAEAIASPVGSVPVSNEADGGKLRRGLGRQVVRVDALLPSRWDNSLGFDFHPPAAGLRLFSTPRAHYKTGFFRHPHRLRRAR
jgi:hypothetical protein